MKTAKYGEIRQVEPCNGSQMTVKIEVFYYRCFLRQNTISRRLRYQRSPVKSRKTEDWLNKNPEVGCRFARRKDIEAPARCSNTPAGVVLSVNEILADHLFSDEMNAGIGKPGQGYDLETGKQVARRLEELGVDAIDVSSAGYDTYNYR